MAEGPSIVVLAAGQGSRFGGSGHKLGQPFGPGTVLGGTLRHAVESGLEVVAVTTAALAEDVAQHLARRDIVVLDASEAARGMGHSIAAGVAAHAGAGGWLVLPGDMPLVRPATMLAVARALDEHPIAYAQFRGRRGHPVAFGAEFYSELIMLKGDEGARRLLGRYPAFGVDVDDHGVLLDVDTEDDLSLLREEAGDA